MFDQLMRDFGYRFSGDTLIECGIRGFTSDRIVPYKFKSAMAAAEWLCPIIKTSEYTDRLISIKGK